MFVFVAEINQYICVRLEPLGLDCQILGGGHILASSTDKSIQVYGYSLVCVTISDY